MVKTVDLLGLRDAMADRVLPVLVGAMSFLAALAVAGAIAAAALATHWQGDTSAALTIQVTGPGDPAATGNLSRLNAVLQALATAPNVAAMHQLTTPEIDRLLQTLAGRG